MLDNGYVYPAATRLSAHRSPADWALVIEVFGFSPRTFVPDVAIYTFASQLSNRKTADSYVSIEAHQNYLDNNPYNEMHSAFPIDEGSWQDPDDREVVALGARSIRIRGEERALPEIRQYADLGIELEDSSRIAVFELSRALAELDRELVLATPQERTYHIPRECKPLLLLDEWQHPDVVDPDVVPSGNETFRQLAAALASGDSSLYRPTIRPNTHWSNWPDGGTL